MIPPTKTLLSFWTKKLLRLIKYVWKSFLNVYVSVKRRRQVKTLLKQSITFGKLSENINVNVFENIIFHCGHCNGPLALLNGNAFCANSIRMVHTRGRVTFEIDNTRR